MNSLENIQFPVFLVGLKGSTRLEDGVLFYTAWNNEETVLDDTNIQGDFKTRRALLDETTRTPLVVALCFYEDIIKFKNVNDALFIDSNGRLFKYKKDRMVKLSFHKIEHWIKPRNERYCLVKLDAYPQYFRSLRPPAHNEWYAGVLHFTKKQLLLYGFAEEQYDSTIRKV